MIEKTRFKLLFSFAKKEIDWAFKRVRMIARTRGLKLLQVPKVFSAENKFGKILIIIPRRAGKAHKRNLIKRRVKSIFYEEKLFENIATSILLVREDAAKMSFEQLKEFLVSAFSKKK